MCPPTQFLGGGVNDDSAVILGSDGRLYSLNLSTAATTAGLVLSGAGVPSDPFSALEADPSSDTLWVVSASTLASLTRIDAVSGVVTVVEDDYGGTAGAALEGLARTDTGVFYLAHTTAGPTSAPSLSRVDFVTGVLVDTVPTTLGGSPARVSALAWVGDSLYAFHPSRTDVLYRLNPVDGVLTEVRAASGMVTGGVSAADTTSTGLIYFLGLARPSAVTTLYRLDPAAGTTVAVGVVNLGGALAENLAIATLLSSERISPDHTDTGRGSENGEREDDEEDQTVNAVTMTPGLAVTGAELDWLLALGVIVAVLGVFLIIVGAAARKARASTSALEANDGHRGAPRR